MRYSVVISLFNEAETLEALYQELKKVMDDLGNSYELIFINDGSKDESLSVLQKLQLTDNNIKIINFKNNLGPAKALQAGFDRALGEIIVSLDADMQNDPTDIPVLLQRLNQGYDLVCGWRRNRQDVVLKRILSSIGNSCQRLLLHTPVHDICCGLRAYRRVCVKGLGLNGKGMQCFIPMGVLVFM